AGIGNDRASNVIKLPARDLPINHAPYRGRLRLDDQVVNLATLGARLTDEHSPAEVGAVAVFQGSEIERNRSAPLQRAILRNDRGRRVARGWWSDVEAGMERHPVCAECIQGVVNEPRDI